MGTQDGCGIYTRSASHCQWVWESAATTFGPTWLQGSYPIDQPYHSFSAPSRTLLHVMYPTHSTLELDHPCSRHELLPMTT